MIKILDKYLLKQFFLFLITGTLIFVFIFIIVDMSDNLTSYIDGNRGMREIFFLYIYQIPSLIILLFPIGSLIALFFSIGIMVKNNELIAIKSSGISIYRFLLPLMIFILFFSLILFVFNETIVVKSRKHYRQLKERKKFTLNYARNFYVFQNKDIILHGRLFKKEDNSITNPKLYFFGKNNHIKKIIIGEKAFYNNNWNFLNCEIINIDSVIKKEYFTSKDIVELSIKPEDILIDIENVDIYSIKNLFKIIKSIKKSGYDYKKQISEIVYRFYYIIITFIIILMGSAFVVNTKTKGLIFGLSMSILMSFIYWGVLQSFRSLGENGSLSPFVSITIPNIIFLSIGIFLLIKAKK